MSLYTEEQLRSMLGPPREGMRLALSPDARFSPSAADFLRQWRIDIVPTADRCCDSQSTTSRPGWDFPAEFPVVLEGDLPQCSLCGSPIKHKPEHMTQVDAHSYAAKNSPRIRFRGRMDSLNALTMLVAARARALGYEPLLREHLASIAAFCREIISAEYHGREVAPIEVAGYDDHALRKATHHPAEEIGVQHLTPHVEDVEILHWLNYLRTQVREMEIVAIDTFAPIPDHPIVAPDLIHAVNRLSSAVYLVELMFVRGDYESRSEV